MQNNLCNEIYCSLLKYFFFTIFANEAVWEGALTSLKPVKKNIYTLDKNLLIPQYYYSI